MAELKPTRVKHWPAGTVATDHECVPLLHSEVRLKYKAPQSRVTWPEKAALQQVMLQPVKVIVCVQVYVPENPV